MLSIGILCFVAALFLAGVNSEIETRFLTLRIDHFNPQERQTWQMRFFVNNEHYSPGGPIFMYISDGFEVTQSYLTSGLVYDLAVEVGGFLLAAEPRFFGHSRPTNDTSTENMRYMTVEQTTADMAYLIASIRDIYPGLKYAKTILFGKSMGASIAVWTRQQYPFLVNGVLASSASLAIATTNDDFFQNVGQTLIEVGGQRCYDRVQRAFEQIELEILSGDSGRLNRLFRTCVAIDLTNDNSIAMVFYYIAINIGRYVQESSTGAQEMCDTLNSEEHDDDLDAVAAFVNIALGPDNCSMMDYRFLMLILGDVRWDSGASMFGDRQVYYVQCSQLGNWQTTIGAEQPFGHRLTLDKFIDVCGSLFGDIITNEMLDTNIQSMHAFYGGLNLSVRNVFFTSGALDPLRTLSVLEDLNEDSPAAVILNEARSKDLASIDVNDSVELLAVKRRSRELILKWLI